MTRFLSFAGFQGRLRIVAVCAAMAAVPLCVAPPLALAADPAAEAERAARNLDLQTRMPGAGDRDFDRASTSDFNWKIPEDIAQILLWSAIILGAALVLWAMRDSLPGFSRSRRLPLAKGAPAAAPSLAERMDEAQLEADDLARQGQFAEAMHVLLLRCLAELRRRLDVSFAVSLTSREILQRISLPPAGRAGFADIVERVERAYFGRHHVGAPDYEACRRSFETLTAALAAGTRG